MHVIYKRLFNNDRTALLNHWKTLDPIDLERRFFRETNTTFLTFRANHIDFDTVKILAAIDTETDSIIATIEAFVDEESKIQIAFSTIKKYRRNNISTTLFYLIQKEFALNNDIYFEVLKNNFDAYNFAKKIDAFEYSETELTKFFKVKNKNQVADTD